MNRGELYRVTETVAERGDKPGFYVVVSRDFIAAHQAVDTVICAPVYGQVLGIPTEVVLESFHGVRQRSAIRCDFLMLMFKRKLTNFIASLPEAKLKELDRALAIALDLPVHQ